MALQHLSCPTSWQGSQVIAGSEPSRAVPASNLAGPSWFLTTSLQPSCTYASSRLLLPPYIRSNISAIFGFPGFIGSKSFTLLKNIHIAAAIHPDGVLGEDQSPAMGVFLYCNIACKILSQSGLPSALVLSSNVLLAMFTPVSALRLPCGL